MTLGTFGMSLVVAAVFGVIVLVIRHFEKKNKK